MEQEEEFFPSTPPPSYHLQILYLHSVDLVALLAHPSPSAEFLRFNCVSQIHAKFEHLKKTQVDEKKKLEEKRRMLVRQLLCEL